MITPKGTGWQHLRSLCFDAIPAGAAVHYTRALPLHEWRRHGSFQVTACTKKSITLEGADVEIGTALLADAEYLLDHAAEHHATVRDFISEGDWQSPAWTVVTAYYWVFFSALAMTRLSGRTTWFLDRAALTDMRRLAGTMAQPGAGALNVTVGPYVSGSSRQVILFPSRAQVHDALWTRFHELVANVFVQTDQSSNPLEYRLFWCLHEARSRLGTDWPSKIRNLVNYSPGRAYREVVRDTEIDVASYVRRKTPFTSERVISDLEDHILKLKTGMSLSNEVPLLCRLLVLFAVAIGEIARDIHLELIDRSNTDRRWLNVRDGFLRKRCPGNDKWTYWPLISA